MFITYKALFSICRWSKSGLTYLCRRCCMSKTGMFDIGKGLRRMTSAFRKIQTSASLKTFYAKCQLCHESELLLHETFQTRVPEFSMHTLPCLTHFKECECARKILQQIAPVALSRHRPLEIKGDGNCLYRAVSLALFATEDHHLRVRYCIALEIIGHPECYDNRHRLFTDLINRSIY